jgi:glutamate racemase
MKTAASDEGFDARPIGLFDSGIGGLTVLKSLISALPQESFLYLGDTARLPYGSKSPATIERYLKQNIRFLSEQNVKAVVVACNSASTVLLDQTSKFEIPVYNVIEPGAETALRHSRQKRIGVLGTKATVGAKAYVRSLHALDSSAVVFQQACPLLVPLVEEGWENDPLTNLVIYRYVTPIVQAGVDTIILGCTHYPALQEGIARVVGPGVTLVDSAQAIAGLIRSDLASGKLKASQNAEPLRIMTTDVSPSFVEVATRLMHPITIPNLIAVDIGTA